jgi:uncharacterized membrane-anchored protein
VSPRPTPLAVTAAAIPRSFPTAVKVSAVGAVCWLIEVIAISTGEAAADGLAAANLPVALAGPALIAGLVGWCARTGRDAQPSTGQLS